MLLKQLLPSDLPFGHFLNTQAGWNQTASDWDLLLSLSPGGSFLACLNGQKAGTVTTIRYDDQFSWVGMVLVDPALRGRGIGTRLLQSAIEFAQPFGPVVLDATPKGRKLYQTLGFKDVCHLERLEIRELPVIDIVENIAVLPVEKQFLRNCINYDAVRFGASRSLLLESFFGRNPQYGYMAMKKDTLTGYCMGRSGIRFEHIGPVMADDLSTAKALFAQAAGHCRGRPVILDVMSDQVEWRSYFQEIGFKVQRPFIRMCLGDWLAQKDRSRQFAIAGPEFG